MTSDGTLGKPSLLATAHHFENLTIALVHADLKAAIVVKSVLDSLGCRAILLMRDGRELLARAAKEKLDICVIDSEVQPAGGVEAVSQLRQCDLPFVRGLPVILLGPGNNPEAVCAARDAGSNEYVRKPFTAKSLISSEYSVVNDPRPFVISKGFIGPDRRVHPFLMSGREPASVPRRVLFSFPDIRQSAV